MFHINGALTTQKPKGERRRKSTPIPDYITSFTKDNVTTYQCNICRKRFKTKAHIHYHLVCKTGMKPFTCEHCGKGFITKNHFEYHLRQHTGDRPFKCLACGKGYAQQGHATRHIKRTHAGIDPIKCNFSSTEFQVDKLALMASKNNHGVISEPHQFTCRECGKEFYLQEELEKHTRCHSNLRPFTCSECPMAFHKKRDCERHRLVHNNAHKIECPICERRIGRHDNFKRHLRRHQEKGETAADTPLTEKEVPKFNYSSDVRNHIEGSLRQDDFNVNPLPYINKSKQEIQYPQSSQMPVSCSPLQTSARNDYIEHSRIETNTGLPSTLRHSPIFIPVPIFVLFPYIMNY